LTKIRVTQENCEQIAQELVERLFDKDLTMVSSFVGIAGSEDPKIISGVKLLSGFTLEEGRLRIPLKPRRNIFWDVAKEKVFVTFHDNGVILIERDLGDSKKIYRTIVGC
jgi:hypothetical protein